MGTTVKSANVAVIINRTLSKSFATWQISHLGPISVKYVQTVLNHFITPFPM